MFYQKAVIEVFLNQDSNISQSTQTVDSTDSAHLRWSVRITGHWLRSTLIHKTPKWRNSCLRVEIGKIHNFLYVIPSKALRRILRFFIFHFLSTFVPLEYKNVFRSFSLFFHQRNLCWSSRKMSLKNEFFEHQTVGNHVFQKKKKIFSKK